jgi:hypothetical protein
LEEHQDLERSCTVHPKTQMDQYATVLSISSKCLEPSKARTLTTATASTLANSNLICIVTQTKTEF